MGEDNQAENDKKQTVSIPLNNADRITISSAATRLYVRESQLYRLAISHLINKLPDDTHTGCDLLPLFLEFREGINIHLGLKKHQLFKIFNDKNNIPDKFVAMADIELLLLPRHALRQRLQQLSDASALTQSSTDAWLKSYLAQKYHLIMDVNHSTDRI